jgi:hypothetical protein
MPVKLKYIGQWIGFKGISFGILIRLNLPQLRTGEVEE